MPVTLQVHCLGLPEPLRPAALLQRPEVNRGETLSADPNGHEKVVVLRFSVVQEEEWEREFSGPYLRAT